ncbi:glycosyltransferase, partial [Marivita sp.]|uniref:glycosyltransferase n=1 Tax=Marivita sp. TaxID=2003365 RepID=UPI0025BE9A67
GVNVALVSAEGDGPFDPNPDFLTTHPDLDALHATGRQSTAETVDILSRTLFPPRVSDMRGPLNLLHGYAWEETGLPQDYTRDMTAHLQGLLVTAPHVKKLFEDAGIGLPIHVVGNGVDHLDVPPEPLPITLPQAGFTCLHVSSCFPRKGPDVLLKSFAQAFDADDDVQLLIKTFANPHNDIGAQISALRATYPNLPPITVIEDPFTPGQMRSLYATADLLIAPSRAEGYCLPVAEAVLARTPVLTTGWGGQKIFAGNPLVHFIDYTFAPAQSHLVKWDSVWAEPDQTDLVDKLKVLRSAPKPSQETCAEASRQILTEHTWGKVAERSRNAVQQIAACTPTPPPRVGWVSSYNTRCGIATYSAHLIEAFPDETTVFASHTMDRIASDNVNIRRCWQQNGRDTLAQLQAQIRATNPQILVIQFNYGFFSFPHLGALILQAKADGRQVVMMMHATDDSAVPPDRQLARIRPALEACDQLLVHSHHDLNHLKSIGLEDNVSLFPHGVPYAAVPAPPKMSPDRPVVLGTYGFFLPPKGLDQLIEAVAHVRNQGENVALEMINAEFPIRDSAEAIDAARQQILELGLDGHVNLETRFLDDADSFSRLARADALVFSYQKTAESASGAIRQALALDRPVLATPLRIFDDVEPLIMRFPGTTAEAIAQGIQSLSRALRNPDAEPQTTGQLETMRSNANRWREGHAYQVLGPRLWRQICSLER